MIEAIPLDSAATFLSHSTERSPLLTRGDIIAQLKGRKVKKKRLVFLPSSLPDTHNNHICIYIHVYETIVCLFVFSGNCGFSLSRVKKGI